MRHTFLRVFALALSFCGLVLTIPAFSNSPSGKEKETKYMASYKLAHGQVTLDQVFGGHLWVSESAVVFKPSRADGKRMKKSEVTIPYVDIASYQKGERTEFTIWTRQGEEFIFIVFKKDEVIGSIEMARERFFASKNETAPALVALEDLPSRSNSASMDEPRREMDDSVNDQVLSDEKRSSFTVDFFAGTSKKGELYTTGSAVRFNSKKTKDIEIAKLTDVIGYKIEGDYTFHVLLRGKDAKRTFNVRKIQTQQEVIDAIEDSRQYYYVSKGLIAPRLNDLGDYQLIDPYVLVDGNVKENELQGPDVIITADMDIIDAVVYRIADGEVLFKEYPLDSGSEMFSLPVSSVRRVRRYDGREYAFTVTNSTSESSAQGPLKTKGLWILNSDNQKLTYETSARYLDERSIDQYRHIRHRGNTGNTFKWIGLGILAVDGVMYELKIVDHMWDRAFDYDDPAPLYGYLLSIVTGGTIALVGSLISHRAEKSLDSLVSEWNASQQISLSNGLSFGVTDNGFGLKYNF